MIITLEGPVLIRGALYILVFLCFHITFGTALIFLMLLLLLLFAFLFFSITVKNHIGILIEIASILQVSFGR